MSNENWRVSDSLPRVAEALDRGAMESARKRQEKLAKPPGSLGNLEEISVKMAGITRKTINNVAKTCVIIMCADNGVAEEGVASAPQSVTMAQTVNFTRRLTGVGVLAESFGSDLLIVDMGVRHEIPDELYTDEPLEDTRKIVGRRIRNGTFNIAEGPAMKESEVIQCINTGREMAKAAKRKGYDLIGVGEMGIGNTTTSAAVLSSITGLSSGETCGRGGGINDRSYLRKKEIVDSLSEKYRKLRIYDSYQNGTSDTAERRDLIIKILSEMGGFDLCGMTGVFIGAGENRIPVVIDGYISAVTALAAEMTVPGTVEYMFPSHKSSEKGYEHAVSALGLKPFLDLDMRLGEGSGCPVAFQVIKAACDILKNMATFDEAKIDDGYLDEIRKGGCF